MKLRTRCVRFYLVIPDCDTEKLKEEEEEEEGRKRKGGGGRADRKANGERKGKLKCHRPSGESQKSLLTY